MTSTVGVGSEFLAELVLPRAAVDSLPAERERPASCPPAAAPERGKRVLLVEDNAVNRMVAERFLAKLDDDVDVVHDGAAALARVTEDPSYDLVLMDCQMPVMDGLEATRRIRALGGRAAQLPIVALTASAMAAEREQCFLAGMNDFLTKPLRAGVLASALARHTGPPPEAS